MTAAALVFVADRPRPQGRAGASWVFAVRGLLKIRHMPEQLADVVAIPIVFTVMFTYLFGGAIAGSPKAYLQYILPGTLVMAVLLVTMYSGIVLRTDLDNGVHDRFRSLPVWRPAPLVGAVVADTARYLVSAALVLLLGLVMGFRPGAGPLRSLAAVALVVAFALALSWLWLLVAMLVRSATAVTGAATVVLFPLTLATNVFVRPATMPGWLRTVVQANPVTHLVSAERLLLAGRSATGDVLLTLLGAAVLVVVCAPLAVRLYGRRT